MQRLNPFAVAPDGIAALRGRGEISAELRARPQADRAREDAGVANQRLCVLPPHAHAGGSALGETDRRLYLLDAWHESGLYSDRERAALAWAEALTNIAVSRAPDDVYAATRRQFSEKELADLSIVIAMINAWNRLAIGARAVHPADRAKAA